MSRVVIGAVVGAAILGSGCAGHLPPPEAPPVAGWVDFGRVRAGSSLGRMLDDGHAQVARAKQAEVDKTTQQLGEAEKRKDKDLAIERQQAVAHVQQLQSELQQDDEQAMSRLLRAIQPVAAAVARARHLATVDLVPAGRLWSSEDLTDDVIRQLDTQATAGAVAKPEPPPKK